MSPPDDTVNTLDRLFQLSVASHATPVAKNQLALRWAAQSHELAELIDARAPESVEQALRTLGSIVDTLEIYAPGLNGLLEVHAFVIEQLEGLVFDHNNQEETAATAAGLYGQAMTMSPITVEGLGPAIDALLRRSDASAANRVLSVLLGVEGSNQTLFEAHLPILLRQVQQVAFSHIRTSTPKRALEAAVNLYAPGEKSASCQLLLRAVHSLLVASLRLCQTSNTRWQGIDWVCFIVQSIPMALRLDLQRQYAQTSNAVAMFQTISPVFEGDAPDEILATLCRTLPILTTWDTPAFVTGTQAKDSIEYMMKLCHVGGSMLISGLYGVGKMSNVILDEFEPYLPQTASLALSILKGQHSAQEQTAAQELLVRLLAALGPMTLDVMSEYLRLPPSVLLTNIQLLENIATLLSKLSDRIIGFLTTIIRKLINGSSENYDLQIVLEALEVFPLNDPGLARLTQELVLWSLKEDKGRGPVMAALSLATNPAIGHHSAIRPLTYRAAQLLHADDPQIVHLALNVLSDPRLASVLDERSCTMILLALHQSLEPSMQIVAAKLLTHLTKAHRAIVQPLAWSHIRQSLGLMDFLQRVDPTRAVVEACIISNLLPALPKSLHKKYVGPVKKLILSGLEPTQAETPTLSLVFQGLANLASFEGWSASQQANLASDLLDMISEIPKDSQHSALNAVSRLLSIPTEGLEVYDLLIKVHAMLGGRSAKLEPDLKALVSSIYGHLGTVERNPVISRDSKAAINRETSMYTRKARLAAQVAEVRDRYRADSQTHINWLVTKNLLAAFAPEHKVVEERAIVLEVMISFGILQPAALPTLIPDLPNLLFSELRNALNSKEGHKEVKDTSVPVSAGILFLAAALHISPAWLEEHWTETADVFGEALKGGEVLPVLRGLGVILDAIEE